MASHSQPEDAAAPRQWSDIPVSELNNIEAERRAELEKQMSAGEDTLREMYNLSSVLVHRQKWVEAEPLLRKLLRELQERETGRETSNFMFQEAGTMRLLASSLTGLGQETEGNEMLGEAEAMRRRAESVRE